MKMHYKPGYKTEERCRICDRRLISESSRAAHVCGQCFRVLGRKGTRRPC